MDRRRRPQGVLPALLRVEERPTCFARETRWLVPCSNAIPVPWGGNLGRTGQVPGPSEF